jgi:hypothetical protein
MIKLSNFLVTHNLTSPHQVESETLIIDSLYPKVSKILSNPNNVQKIKAHLSKFFDRNSHILFSLNFTDRLIVFDADKAIFFEVLEMSEKEIQTVLDESPFGKIKWVLNPITVAILLCILYFDKKKMEKEVEIMEIFLTCYFYSLLHPKIFNFPPNPAIMEYTLTKNPNVTGNFIFKKEGDLFNSFKHMSRISHENYIKDLEMKKTDKMVNDYVGSIRTRLNSLLKNIMNYFLEDHRAGHYFNREADINEDDKFRLADSTTLFISKLSGKTTTNIISYKFSRTLIEKIASSDINLHPVTLVNILNTIIERYRHDVDRFISSIIELYVIEGNNNATTINTSKFINECLYLYKSNSSKPRVVYLKNTLDQWIAEGSKLNGQRFIREATIYAYRKAIFTMFVYSINKESQPS